MFFRFSQRGDKRFEAFKRSAQISRNETTENEIVEFGQEVEQDN